MLNLFMKLLTASTEASKVVHKQTVTFRHIYQEAVRVVSSIVVSISICGGAGLGPQTRARAQPIELYPLGQSECLMGTLIQGGIISRSQVLLDSTFTLERDRVHNVKNRSWGIHSMIFPTVFRIPTKHKTNTNPKPCHYPLDNRTLHDHHIEL